jgi:hypothetical protein
MLDNIHALRSKKAKRIYGVLSILLTMLWIVVLLIIENRQMYIEALYYEMLKNIFTNLVSTTITASIVLGIFLFLVPYDKKFSETIILEPQQTKKYCIKILSETTFWYHFGHIGRWVRTEVLPVLAHNSREKNQPSEVIFAILDPLNSDLLTEYIDFKESIAFIDKSIKSTIDVKAELYTTIVLSANYNNDNRNQLKVSVYLRNDFRSLREDICSGFTLISHIDPRVESLLYLKSNNNNIPNLFYNTCYRDFHTLIRKLHKVDVSGLQNLNKQEVVTFLERNFRNEKFDDNLVSRIMLLIPSKYHPYK